MESVRTKYFLAFEQVRLSSFANYPLCRIPPSREILAAQGFYYVKSHDRVRYALCGLGLRFPMRVNYWENPREIHANLSPNCPFVMGKSRNIRMYDYPIPPTDKYRFIYADEDDDGTSEEAAAAVGATSVLVRSALGLDNFETLVIAERPWKNPGEARKTLRKFFQFEQVRFASFRGFSGSKIDSPARAGFYYTQRADVVRCAYCDLRLRDWSCDDAESGDPDHDQDADDLAMEIHKQWNSEYPLIRGEVCDT